MVIGAFGGGFCGCADADSDVIALATRAAKMTILLA
jgi:hypothetical protein